MSTIFSIWIQTTKVLFNQNGNNNPMQNFINQIYILKEETYFVMVYYKCFSEIFLKEYSIESIPRHEEILTDGMQQNLIFTF